MSFNINMKQPQKPKIGMKDKGSVTDTIGFDGNALSQKPKEVTDVQFGNSARDNLLQKQIEAIRNDVNVRVDNVENQVDLISIKCDNTVTKVDSLGRQVSNLDTKVNNEKTARENADTQLQKSIDEIDEKIEHLDKYAEKTTTVGGVSLEESTESLDDYKMVEDIGFKSLPNWQTFEDVINFDDNPLVMVPIYGDPSILDDIIPNLSNGLSKRKNNLSIEKKAFKTVSQTKSQTKSSSNIRTYKVKMIDVLDAETIESHQENDAIATDCNDILVGYYELNYMGTNYLCLNYFTEDLTTKSDDYKDLYYHPAFNKWVGWYGTSDELRDYEGDPLTLSFAEEEEPPQEIVDEETLLKILDIDNRLLLCLGVKSTEDNEDTEINEEDIKLFLLIYIENLKRDEENVNGDIYFNIFGNSDNIFEILKELLPIGIELPISIPTNVWLYLGVDNIEGGTIEDITQLLDKIKIGVEKPKAFNVDENLINVDYTTLFDASYNREKSTVTLDNKLDAIYNESTVINKFIPALPKIIGLLSLGLSNLVGIAHLTHTVYTNEWYQSNNVDGYPYEATISEDVFEYCEKVDVIFGINECISGNYAPINYLDNENHCVSIFAKQIPDTDIEINIDAFVKPTLMPNR